MSVAKRSVIALAVTLLVIAGISTIITNATDDVDDRPPEFHVYPSSGTRATPVQTLINNAPHGAVIYIHAGVYAEKLDVHKGVMLVGAPGETMPIFTSPPGTTGPFGHTRLSLCTITSTNAQYPVVLDGLEFSYDPNDNWNYSAIKIQAGDGHEIKNCVVNGSYLGIWVHSGETPLDPPNEFTEDIVDVRIHHNNITNIAGHGIYLQRTKGFVYQNNINNSKDGIMVALGWTGSRQDEGKISENRINNCSVGVYLKDSNPKDYVNNEIWDCQIGEVIEGTQPKSGLGFTNIIQTSQNNNITFCRIGSKLEATTGTRLIENKYENCSTSIVSNNSVIFVEDIRSNDTTEFSINASITELTLDGLSAMRGQTGIKFTEMNESSIVDSVIDGQGDFGILLDKCAKISIDGTQFNGFLDPVLPVWDPTNLSHLDHDIPPTNTADGGPIFYTYGDVGIIPSLSNAGQIFIANSQSSQYRFTQPHSRLARVVESSNVDLQDSSFPAGLVVWESTDVQGDGLSIDHSDRIGAALELYEENIQKTTCSFYDPVIDGGAEDMTAIKMARRSILDLYSPEITGINTFEGPSSEISYYSSIGMEVYYQGGTEPVEGAEYRIMSDANQIHSTPLFDGGTDPVTGPEGIAGPFWAIYRTEKMESDNTHTFTITVNVTADLSWEETRPVDASTDHDEQFITTDIRKPAIPQNFRGIAVSNGDANRLEWDANNDDTVLYRLYYLDGMDWVVISEEDITSFEHSDAPNGTSAYYKLTSVDEAGLESPFTDEAEVLTTDMVPPTPPRDLRVFNITDTSLSLSWKTSLSPDTVFYEVFLVEADMTRATGVVTAAIRKIDSTTDTFMDIEEILGEESAFAVRAVDEAGNPSEFSNPVSLEASDLTWPTISNIQWIYGASSARITWETDEPTTSTIWFGSSIDDFSSYGPTELGTSHLMEIDDLDPETTYFFYVFAVEPSGNYVTDNNEGLFYSFTTFGSEGFIRITILDQDNEPAIGILVSAISEDEQEVMIVETTAGNYEAILVPGNWTITVVSLDHSPYAPFNATIEANIWFNTSIQLTSILWVKANLTIIVVDESGNTVIGATILVDGTEYTTGPGGIADLGEVDTDSTYMITVTAPGFEEFSKSIYVPAKGKDQSETVAIIHEEEPVSNDDFMMWIIILIIAVVLLLLILVIALIFLKKRKSEPEDKEEDKEDKKVDAGPEAEVKKGAIGGKSLDDKPNKVKGKKDSKKLKGKESPVKEGNILTPAEPEKVLPPAKEEVKKEPKDEKGPEDKKEEEAPPETDKKEGPEEPEVKKEEPPKEEVKEPEAPEDDPKVEQPPLPEAPKPEAEYIKPQ